MSPDLKKISPYAEDKTYGSGIAQELANYFEISVNSKKAA